MPVLATGVLKTPSTVGISLRKSPGTSSTKAFLYSKLYWMLPP